MPFNSHKPEVCKKESKKKLERAAKTADQLQGTTHLMSFATDVKSSSELLKGKWVLITGASKGVGEGIAVTFAKHGACVALVARSQDKLEQVGLP